MKGQELIMQVWYFGEVEAGGVMTVMILLGFRALFCCFSKSAAVKTDLKMHITLTIYKMGIETG